MTEPDSGSDAFAMTTRAVPERRRLPHQRHQDVHLQRPGGRPLRRLRRDRPREGLPRRRDRVPGRSDTPGVTSASKIEKMGLRTSPLSELVLRGRLRPGGGRPGRRGRRIDALHPLHGLGADLPLRLQRRGDGAPAGEGGRVRAHAPAVRQADREVPGRLAQDRRHEDAASRRRGSWSTAPPGGSTARKTVSLDASMAKLFVSESLRPGGASARCRSSAATAS